jgi:hypothetical protein
MNDGSDASDGLHIPTRIWSAYREATRSKWKKNPVFLTAGYILITSEPLRSNVVSVFKSGITALTNTLKFLKNSGTVTPIIDSCDALIFRSSNKPSTEAPTNILAQRLAASGFRCAVIEGSRKLSIWEPESKTAVDPRATEIANYSTWLSSSSSRLRATSLILRSVFDATALIMLLLLRGGSARAVLKIGPFNIWLQLLMSNRRLEASKEILRVMNPRLLLINSERVPVGAELVNASSGTRTRKILFMNELPLPAVVPVLSDEAWVWNKSVVDSIGEASSDYPTPKLATIGSAELDVVRRSSTMPNDSEETLRQWANDSPVFLFIVDYYESKLRDTKDLAAEAHRWVHHTAVQHPTWKFIFKTRPVHHEIELPGLGSLTDLDNMLISRGDVDLERFLNWKNLAAVGGYSSTALYVAAGTGVPVFRFRISRHQFDIPVIDEVTFPIKSEIQLDEAIYDLSSDDQPLHDRRTLVEDEDSNFPHLRLTLEIMENRCLEILSPDVSGN